MRQIFVWRGDVNGSIFCVWVGHSVSASYLLLTTNAHCFQEVRDRGFPAVVSCVRPGSIAHRSDGLRVGEVLAGVNGTPLENLSHLQILSLLRSHGTVLHLTLEYDLDDPCMHLSFLPPRLFLYFFFTPTSSSSGSEPNWEVRDVGGRGLTELA